MQSGVPSTVPAGRYGQPTSRRTRLIVIGGLSALVLGAIGWFAFAAYASRDSATGTDVGFTVVSDASIQITFDVTKPQSKTATCVVQALDSGFAVVGTARVQIGPAKHGVVRQTATVRTSNRATSGQVESCSVAP